MAIDHLAEHPYTEVSGGERAAARTAEQPSVRGSAVLSEMISHQTGS